MTSTFKNLYEIEPGEKAEISGFTNENAEHKAARMGIFLGKIIKCVYKGKAVIIAMGYSNIALDKSIARQIYIDKTFMHK